MKEQSLENVAAIRLQIAQTALESAACSLLDVGSDEAKLHAREAVGAVKMLRKWELELRRIHAGK
jgi:hypothetical protein